MNKFIIVFKHSFLSNFKKKSFLVSTLITLLLILLVFNLPTILVKFETNSDIKKIGVIDNTGKTYELLNNQLLLYNDINLLEFNNEETAMEQFNDGNIYGYLIINSKNNLLSVTYKASQINNTAFIAKIEQGLNQIQFQSVAATLGLSDENINKLFSSVTMDKIPLEENAKSNEEIVQSYFLVYIIIFAIYFGVIMYGNMVAMEVAKEKTSRIMEILVSSVNPIAQMFGKILGISLLGIIQIMLMLIIGFLSLKFAPNTFELGGIEINLAEIPKDIIFFGILFYILGYLFYASIAAMFGSIVSRIEDMQQLIGPLNLVLVIAFMIAMYGLSNPDTSFIVISSYIPIFTPMIMFLRIGMSDPGTMEIILSIFIMISSIVLVSVFAAKVFKGGVLMYGKGSSFKDIKQALAIHNKE